MDVRSTPDVETGGDVHCDWHYTACAPASSPRPDADEFVSSQAGKNAMRGHVPASLDQTARMVQSGPEQLEIVRGDETCKATSVSGPETQGTHVLHQLELARQLKVSYAASERSTCLWLQRMRPRPRFSIGGSLQPYDEAMRPQAR